MLIDRQAIAQLIPHTGTMCLLDAVQAWDEQSIHCVTGSHRRPDNPFLEPGLPLDAAILIEYGAQAAAVHAALLQQGMAGQGTAYLGAIKNLQLYQPQVDGAIELLTVRARCELNSQEGAIYQIDCGAEDQAIISARVVLVLPGAVRPDSGREQSL